MTTHTTQCKSFHTISWQDIRDRVYHVNADMAALLDRLAPGEMDSCVIAHYPFLVRIL